MKMLWLLKRAILWREKARSRPRIYLLLRVYLLLVSPVEYIFPIYGRYIAGHVTVFQRYIWK